MQNLRYYAARQIIWSIGFAQNINPRLSLPFFDLPKMVYCMQDSYATLVASTI